MLKKCFSTLQNVFRLIFLIVQEHIKKIRCYYIRIQINNEFARTGKSAFEIAPHLAAQFNLPIVQLKEEDLRLEQKLKSLNDVLNDKILTLQTRKREFDALASELNAEKTRKKAEAKKNQNLVRENQKKLKAKLSSKDKRSKEYTLLTIFKGKADLNNTVIDLTNTVNRTLAENEDLKADLQRLEVRHAGAVSDWTMLERSLNSDIKSLQAEVRNTQSIKEAVMKKMAGLYPELGFRMDKENLYPEPLAFNREKIRQLKSSLQ